MTVSDSKIVSVSDKPFLPVEAYEGWEEKEPWIESMWLKVIGLVLCFVSFVTYMTTLVYYTSSMAHQLDTMVMFMRQMHEDTHSMCIGLQQIVPNTTCG